MKVHCLTKMVSRHGVKSLQSLTLLGVSRICPLDTVENRLFLYLVNYCIYHYLPNVLIYLYCKTMDNLSRMKTLGRLAVWIRTGSRFFATRETHLITPLFPCTFQWTHLLDSSASVTRHCFISLDFITFSSISLVTSTESTQPTTSYSFFFQFFLSSNRPLTSQRHPSRLSWRIPRFHPSLSY